MFYPQTGGPYVRAGPGSFGATRDCSDPTTASSHARTNGKPTGQMRGIASPTLAPATPDHNRALRPPDRSEAVAARQPRTPTRRKSDPVDGPSVAKRIIAEFRMAQGARAVGVRVALISRGFNVASSRAGSDAQPTVPLSTYTHPFDRADHSGAGGRRSRRAMRRWLTAANASLGDTGGTQLRGLFCGALRSFCFSLSATAGCISPSSG
jgi:hypothetical protein